MCSLCGILGGNEHWADAVARPGVFTRNGDRIDRRRERMNRVRIACQVLEPFGMSLSDRQGERIAVAPGQPFGCRPQMAEIVDDLGLAGFGR